MRTILLLFLLLSASFSLFPESGKKGGSGGAKKERIVLERPLKKGDFFSCFARINRTSEYTLALPGTARPIERRDSLTLSLAGILQIREVNRKGQAEKIALYISSLSGSCNGRQIKGDDWTGLELLGDLTSSPARFSSPSLKRAVTRDEQQLFGTLFPGGGGDSASLSALTAPILSLRPGERFPLRLAPLINSLAARKITCSQEALAGEGIFTGRTRFREIDVYKFSLNIISRKVPGYDLKLQSEILLPVDETLGPALQLSRNGREFINKIVSSSNQFAAGARLSQMLTDESSVTLLPESSPTLPGKASQERSGGFHELLRPRK